MDAVIVLTFIVGVYFVFEYLKLNKKIPQRSSKLIPATQAQKKQSDETTLQVDLLMNSKQFQDYLENKSKLIESDYEKGNGLENETDILRELEEK